MGFFKTFTLHQNEHHNKECISTDCLKPSGLINYIRCDCCSSSYHISKENISLSDSKKPNGFNKTYAPM